MMTYRVEGPDLVLDEGETVTFDLPIDDVLAFDDFVVVTLSPTGADARNVYAIGKSGEMLWRMPSAPQSWIVGTYFGARRASEGNIEVFHDSGVVYEVEARTGRILSKVLAK